MDSKALQAELLRLSPTSEQVARCQGDGLEVWQRFGTAAVVTLLSVKARPLGGVNDISCIWRQEPTAVQGVTNMRSARHGLSQRNCCAGHLGGCRCIHLPPVGAHRQGGQPQPQPAQKGQVWFLITAPSILCTLLRLDSMRRTDEAMQVCGGLEDAGGRCGDRAAAPPKIQPSTPARGQAGARHDLAEIYMSQFGPELHQTTSCCAAVPALRLLVGDASGARSELLISYDRRCCVPAVDYFPHKCK